MCENEFSPMIVEELLLHSYSEMSCLILKILAKYLKKHHPNYLENDELQSKIDTNFNLAKDAFIKLVNNGYLERLPDLEVTEILSTQKLPTFKSSNDTNKYELPEIKIDSK